MSSTKRGNSVKDPDAPPAYDDLFGNVNHDAPATQNAGPTSAIPHAGEAPQQQSTSIFLENASVLFPELTPNPAANLSHQTPISASRNSHAEAGSTTWQQQEEINELRLWFSACDEDGDGFITSAELQQALLNDDYTPFSMDTIRMCLKLFDHSFNDRIEFDEFAGLKKYVQEWKKVFDRYDADNSGSIDAAEIRSAFAGMGHQFTNQFCNLLCRRFGSSKNGMSMHFDAFIYACAMINALNKDYQKNPRHPSFEAFLSAWITQ